MSGDLERKIHTAYSRTIGSAAREERHTLEEREAEWEGERCPKSEASHLSPQSGILSLQPRHLLQSLCSLGRPWKGLERARWRWPYSSTSQVTRKFATLLK